MVTVIGHLYEHFGRQAVAGNLDERHRSPLRDFSDVICILVKRLRDQDDSCCVCSKV